MSTLKVDNIRHNSATSDAITMASDGTCTAKLTDVGGAALSHRNVLRNGGMTIHQRGGNTTGISNSENYFVADGWIYNHGSNGTVTVSHETDSPDGFSNSIKVAVTSAGTSSNPAQFYQKIEGQDLQRFAKGTSSAKKFAVSFYIKSKVTGNFVLDLYDSDNARSCQQIYTVNASQTWERKTVIIPADTTGAWDNDNNASLQIYWKVFAGNQSGTLHTTWQAHTTNADRGVGQVNALAANGDYVQITGLQMEVGETATSFEHKTFNNNLRDCQRYYYQVGGQTNDGSPNNSYGVILPMAMCASSTRVKGILHHPVPMRTGPSLSGGGSGTCAIQQGDNTPNSTLVYQNGWSGSNTTRYSWVDLSPNSGTISNVGETGIVYAYNSTYHIKVSAEL